MNDAAHQPLRLALCVPTRRRDHDLARALASMSELEIPQGVAARVLVVENDDGHDRPLPPCLLPVERVFEPRVGIPFARNKAIEVACGASDRIVFIDDDETVERDLLVRLLAVERATGADAVTGPSLPRFAADAPAWAARSRAFAPQRYATGSLRPTAFTNNVMFRTDAVRDGTLRFDESMRFTGGSDKEFFARFVASGRTIAWADDAVAYEWYPRARTSFGWLFQRSFRLGSVARQTEGLAGLRGRLAVCWRAVRFALRAAWRALKSLHDPAVALAHAAWDTGRAAGLAYGAFGGR
ncbi:MAG: glycosyltransferase, partial [Phycisphaerales bacterium]